MLLCVHLILNRRNFNIIKDDIWYLLLYFWVFPRRTILKDGKLFVLLRNQLKINHSHSTDAKNRRKTFELRLCIINVRLIGDFLIKALFCHYVSFFFNNYIKIVVTHPSAVP